LPAGVSYIHDNDKSFVMHLQLSHVFVSPPKLYNGICGMHAKGYNVKNNQLVQRRHQSMPQQVICGTCCGDAT